MEKVRYLDSLRTRLAAVFGLLVVVLAVSLAAVLGAEITHRLERQRGVELQGNARNAARELARGLQDRGREIGVLASSAEIWRDGLDSPRVRDVLARTQAISPANTWIGVADLDGAVRAATGGVMVGRNVRERPWFAPGRKASHVGDLHPAQMLAAYLPPDASGEPLRFVDVASPITLGGRVIGVLVSHGSWTWADRVVKALAPPDAARQQMETFIFDQTGKLIYAPDGRTERHLSNGQALPAEARLDQTAFTAVWKDGVSYFASAVSLEADPAAHQNLGWVVVTRQPTDSVLASARDATTDALQLGGVAAAVAAAIAWFVAQRLTRPLTTLSLAARGVAAKEPGARIPVLDGTAEVRRLSLALVEMTDELGRTNQALEQRVDERTEQLARANLLLEELASTDPLTGLLNRRGLDIQLKYATSLARRTGSPLSLILVDADHFKRINDTYGHDVGDATLKHIAQAMKSRLRESDIVARIGGEEFVALLPETDAVGGQLVADRLVAAIASQELPRVGRITVSCGVSQITVATDDGSRALRRADQALYRAKSAGRNRAEFEASAVAPL